MGGRSPAGERSTGQRSDAHHLNVRPTERRQGNVGHSPQALPLCHCRSHDSNHAPPTPPPPHPSTFETSAAVTELAVAMLGAYFGGAALRRRGQCLQSILLLLLPGGRGGGGGGGVSVPRLDTVPAALYCVCSSLGDQWADSSRQRVRAWLADSSLSEHRHRAGDQAAAADQLGHCGSRENRCLSFEVLVNCRREWEGDRYCFCQVLPWLPPVRTRQLQVR